MGRWVGPKCDKSQQRDDANQDAMRRTLKRTLIALPEMAPERPS